jgi:hypothetical protein
VEFKDMLHGWTVRGDLADPLIKRSVSGNIISGVLVFRSWVRRWRLWSSTICCTAGQ